jgi:rod shape determining protein RodA
MLVFALTDYRWLCRWGWIGYCGAVIILAGTVAAGFVMYGAKRWISFGWVGVQPSEFAKVGYLLALAGWLGAKERDPRLWKTVVQTLVILMVPFILIFKQPDFGSAMVLVPVTLAMLMVAGVPGRVFALMAAMGLALAPLAYWQMKDYQRARLVNFLKGEHAPRIGKFDSWNLVQSKIAIGSGGVWGKGWCKGSQSRLGFLPVASKDFIFAVFAEEEGFVGSGLLLLAYGLLLGLGFKIAVGATDRLGMLLATGVVTLLFTHVMVNIGMTIGMLPITGLPLPLFSYGGSFMVVTLLALGLLQSIRLHRRLY